MKELIEFSLEEIPENELFKIFSSLFDVENIKEIESNNSEIKSNSFDIKFLREHDWILIKSNNYIKFHDIKIENLYVRIIKYEKNKIDMNLLFYDADADPIADESIIRKLDKYARELALENNIKKGFCRYEAM